MKTIISICFVIIVSYAYSAAMPNAFLDNHWENFKNVFQKHCSTQEEGARRLVWETNVVEIIHHNLEYDLGVHTYRKGLNEYADMLHDEFVNKMSGYKRSLKTNKASTTFIPPYSVVLPTNVDWRKQGLVTRVKNQGMCGACWAFSATGSLEGQHMKNTGKLVSLSEQNLVDCARPEGSRACEGGGQMDQGFEYVMKNGGIDTEECYKAGDFTCHYNASCSGATCTGYVDIPSGDETALQAAVATIGPISVALDASQFSFQLYSGGIYDEPKCSSDQLDFAALVVGYGTEKGEDYWIVKNSWGTSWGEDGYIKMSRNKNNQCGIATLASYPLV